MEGEKSLRRPLDSNMNVHRQVIPLLWVCFLFCKIRDSGKIGLDDGQFWGTQADNCSHWELWECVWRQNGWANPSFPGMTSLFPLLSLQFVTFIGYFLWTRHCSKSFICINSNLIIYPDNKHSHVKMNG